MSKLPHLLRQLRGDTPLREVAERAGISHTYLSQLEKGTDPRTGKAIQPSIETLKGLARAHNYPYEELLAAAGYIYTEPEPPRRDYLADVLGDQVVDIGEVVPVPVLGRVAAGEPIYAEQNLEGTELTPKADIAGGEYFWLRVSGDSMIGEGIKDGDLVLVRRQPTIENGLIGVVLVNGNEATLKRVYINGDQCVLVSENPAYKPQVYPASEVIIIGEVVKSLRNHNGR